MSDRLQNSMSLAVPPPVADFYEVPKSRLGELQELANPIWGWGAKKRLLSMLGTVRRPVPRYERDGYYLAAVVGYLYEKEIVDTEPEGEYGDLMMNLVERIGGGWDLLEPRQEVIEALEPSRFDVADLRASYEESQEIASPEAGSAMLNDVKLLQEALSACSRESFLLIHMS